MKATPSILLNTCRTGATLALIWVCLGAAAHAQVTCSLAGTGANLGLNFGTHTTVTVNDAASLSPNGVSLSCTNTSNSARQIKVCVELGNGLNGMQDGMRVLQRGTQSRIRYQIYRDAARSLVFGMIPDHAEFTGTVAANGTSQFNTQIRLYGRIPAGETFIQSTGEHSGLFDANNLQVSYGDYASGEAAPDCASLVGNQLSYSSNVRISVRPSCALSVASHITFPDRTSLATPAQTFGRIRVLCMQGIPYTIAINDGLHAQGSQRRMRIDSGGDYLVNYEIYRNSQATARWGSDESERQPRLGNALATVYLVYSRVLGGQTGIKPGVYQDTVLVTVHY